MRHMKKHYMTLLELLVSMAIFSVVMVILASMVYSVSQITRKQQAQTDMYRDQRILMGIITQDLQSLVVSDDTGAEISCAFIAPGSTPIITGDYQYAGAFITNSGLGVTPGTDTSFLSEVVYCRKIYDGGPTNPITKDTPLYRYIVTADPALVGGKWDFTGQPQAWFGGWVNPVTDPDVKLAIVATGVSEFKMDAQLADASFISDPLDANPALRYSTKAPVVITVTAKFQDLGDTTGGDPSEGHAVRTFTKRIFTKRGD